MSGSCDVNLSFQSSCSCYSRVLVACHDVGLVEQFLYEHRNGVYLELGDGDTGDASCHEQRWKVTR